MNSKFGSIALFGTSADPPTFGHKAILEGLSNLFPKVITWASDNPMKIHKACLDSRYHLLNELVRSIDNPKLEVIQELSSPWTIYTIDKAKQIWPKAEFIFVIGSDLTGQIPKWVQVKDILKKSRIGVAPRIGWPINDKELERLSELGGRIDLLPLRIPHSSSSEINTNLDTSKIPNAILEIIIEKKLYGFSRENS